MFLDDLIPDLEAHIPDVTDTVYMYGLQYAVRKFFKDSEVWCVPIPFLNISANAIEFEIDTPSDTVLHAVPMVLVNGKQIKSAGFADIRAMQTRTGVPAFWYRQGTTLHLAPCPSTEFDLEILGVLVPIRESLEIDADEYLNKYSDALSALAASFILSMPNKPWSNNVSSRVFKGQYLEELVIARREALGYLDGRHIMMSQGVNNAYSSDY